MLQLILLLLLPFAASSPPPHLSFHHHSIVVYTDETPQIPQNKNKKNTRAAETSAKPEQSGQVLVIDKPPSETINEEAASRPVKRKTGGTSQGGEEDEDLEVVGTTGTPKLPHNRFACPEVRWCTSFSCYLSPPPGIK